MKTTLTVAGGPAPTDDPSVASRLNMLKWGRDYWDRRMACAGNDAHADMCAENYLRLDRTITELEKRP